MKTTLRVIIFFVLIPGSILASEIQHVLSGGIYLLLLPLVLFFASFIVLPFLYLRFRSRGLAYALYSTGAVSCLLGIYLLTRAKGNDADWSYFFLIAGVLLVLLPLSRSKNKTVHFSIRIATIRDLNVLIEIGKKTFSETFSDQNTEEDMAQYLSTTFTKEKIKTELQNQESEHYLVISNQQPIGYLKINWGKAQTEKNEFSSLEIERIYVLKNYQGLKIGQRLLETAIQKAKDLGANAIWLGVWEKNLKAISFYQKNNFVITGQHTFLLGKDAQTDLLMSRSL